MTKNLCDEGIWGAIQSGDMDAFKARLAHADKYGHALDNEELLRVSVVFERPEMAQEFLNRGADIDAKDSFGLAPVHMATSLEEPTMLQFLLDHGARTDTTDNNGLTAEQYAADLNKAEMVTLLETYVKNNEKPVRMKKAENFVSKRRYAIFDRVNDGSGN